MDVHRHSRGSPSSTTTCVLADDWNARLVADLAGRPGAVGASQARLEVPLPERAPADRRGATDHRIGRGGVDHRRHGLPVARCWSRPAASTSGSRGRSGRTPTWPYGRVRAGFDVVWGERGSEHPVRARGGWRGSIAVQAGNADNALMRAKFGRSWRLQIGTRPGRTGRHAAGRRCRRGAAGAALIAGRPRLAAPGPRSVWAAAHGRVRRPADLARARGPPREIAAMIVTSAAIPPVALFHRLRGEWQRPPAGRPPPGRRPPAGGAVRPRRHLDHQRAVPGRPGGRAPDAGRPPRAQRLRRRGVAVGVVSNQSGVARGLISSRRAGAGQRPGRGPARAVRHLAGLPARRRRRLRLSQAGPGMVEAAARELGVRPRSVW